MNLWTLLAITLAASSSSPASVSDLVADATEPPELMARNASM
jgi:hypothetical protein